MVWPFTSCGVKQEGAGVRWWGGHERGVECGVFGSKVVCVRRVFWYAIRREWVVCQCL
jgi:hypothetical protein